MLAHPRGSKHNLKGYFKIMSNQHRTLPVLTEQDIARFHTKYICGLTPNDCWSWIGAKFKRSYGAFIIRRSSCPSHTFRAHRLAYLIFHQQDPGELLVCHRCDNPSCVNPAHLFLGSHEENMNDRGAKGRDKGERHPSARLTEAQVLNIRQRVSAGVRQGVSRWKMCEILAAEYGVARATITITDIVWKRSWRHI
jgi:hypothetical protein